MREASLKHKERRKKINEERAELRRLEQEKRMREQQKRESDEIPFRWVRRFKGDTWSLSRSKGGAKLTFTKPFFYFGKNMKDSPEPTIKETSGIDPKLQFADNSEYAEPLPPFPRYDSLSEEQRYGYLEFLASEREEAKDIGYVFLYLAGFERRLIIDAAKPDTVSNKERVTLTEELLRLHRCFAHESVSLAHYIDMLLLYDGTVFDIRDEKEIRDLFEIDVNGTDTRNRNRTYCENADSMSYLIVGRMLEHGMKPSLWDIASCAKWRLISSGAASRKGITAEELYDDEVLDRLIIERLRNLDMKRVEEAETRTLSSVRPSYQPSSFYIRKARRNGISLMTNVVEDPSETLPLKSFADIVLACKMDLEECRSVLSTSSLRNIDKVQFDALMALTGNSSPLRDFLRKMDGATYVPVEILAQELKQRYGAPISYTSKGILSAQTQQLISLSAAMLGWQAVLPDSVEGVISSFWRIDNQSKIVVFKRFVAHDKTNGQKRVGAIFGSDVSSYSVSIPGSWLIPTALGYIYAWFLGKLPKYFDVSMVNKFLPKYLPDFATKSEQKHKNQVYCFYSLLHATYSLNLSTHGIKKCLEMTDFAAVQELLFTLCDNTFGNLLPEDVMEALEEVYKKAGQDPAKILYDYHAGTYQVMQQSDMGFVIDEEKFAETMADTTSVQNMLSTAMDTDIEFDTAKEDLPKPRVDIVEASESVEECEQAEQESAAANSDVDATIDTAAAAMSAIGEFFGTTDEKPTSELLAFIIEQGYASTNAEAMGIVAEVNASAGDEIVEIDGADAYWNA